MPFFIPDNFPYFEVCSEINITTPAFFWLVLARYIFSIYLLLIYICVYIWYIVRLWFFSCFFIHCDNFCLFIGTFRPLTFKVIIYIVGLISIFVGFLLVVLLLCLYFFSYFFPAVCSFNWAFYTVPFFSFLSICYISSL